MVTDIDTLSVFLLMDLLKAKEVHLYRICQPTFIEFNYFGLGSKNETRLVLSLGSHLLSFIEKLRD